MTFGGFDETIFWADNFHTIFLSMVKKLTGPQYLTRWELFYTKKITLLYWLSTFMIDSYTAARTIEYFMGLVIIIGRQHRKLWRQWEMYFMRIMDMLADIIRLCSHNTTMYYCCCFEISTSISKLVTVHLEFFSILNINHLKFFITIFW